MEKSYLLKCDSNCEVIKDTMIEVTTRTIEYGVVEFKSISASKLNFKEDDSVYLNAGEFPAVFKYYKITNVSMFKKKNQLEYIIDATKHECTNKK
jgi:hypothetical protein